MVTSLLEFGKIETTVPSKGSGAHCRRMITLGKKQSLASYRQALSVLTKEDVAKTFDEISPRYSTVRALYRIVG
jgi:large subunit ribosomal protein L17